MLFDIMPDHNREIDDLIFLLRNALWSSQNSAPMLVRMFAALYAVCGRTADILRSPAPSV